MFLFQPFLDERERWFLWLPIFMAGGIGLYFALDFEPSLPLLALPIALALLVLLTRRLVFLQPLLAALLAFSMGFSAAQIETRMVAAPMLDAKMPPASITGLLVRIERLPEHAARLTIKDPFVRQLTAEQTPRYLRVKVKEKNENLPTAGQRVSLWGPLWPPAEPVAPDAYNFRRNAFFKQIGGSGLHYGEWRVDKSAPPPSFEEGLYLKFEHMRQALFQTSTANLQEPASSMTAALLSGSQTSIDRDVMRAMRASGLSHLLSISGIHVSMVALLIFVPLRFLLALFPYFALRYPIKKIAAATAIIGTSLYVVLVGPETPTVRSALMTAVVMLAIITDRKAMSMRLVAIAAMPIMLLAPSAVMGPSFQMSFAAVLAMVAFYEKKLDTTLKEGVVFELPTWLRSLWRSGKDIVLTSLVATAATTPFALLHFQVFSFYGVVANVVAIPLTSFWVMPNLLLTYLAMPFGFEAPFVKAAGWGVSGVISLAQEIASWPLAQISMPPLPTEGFLMALGGGLWLCLWRKKWRYVGSFPLVIACFYPLYTTPPSVFVAEENGLWAVRLESGEMLAFGKKKMDFTLSQWQQLANASKVSFIDEKTKTDKVSCENKYCLYTQGAFSIAFLTKEALLETIEKLCATQTIVVAPFTLPACASPYVIDAAALYDRGSHVLTFEKNNTIIKTVREKRGARPWSVGWAHPMP